MKYLKKIGKTIFINIVLLFVFLEIGSLGWYYLKYKQLFYARESGTNSNEIKINLAGVRLTESIIERIHPYFGYVQKPGPDFRPGFNYNYAGFISPYDYPFQKQHKNQYIIGIFGGSVASNYSIFEIENQILANKLRQLPEFQDKELIFLSFASGGYKQPQQLLILNYFISIGQEFDAIVNIDGFNEVTLADANNQTNIDIMMPSTNHLVPLNNFASNSISIKAIRAMLSINESKERLKSGLKTLEKCWLASCYALTFLDVQNQAQSYRKNAQIFDLERQKPAANVTEEIERSILYLYRKNQILPDSELFDLTANHWLKSSIMMKKVAEDANILYFHFLQPNQYYPTNRVYSEEEKKIAFSPNNPFKKATELGYPALLKRGEILKNMGVNFFNAVSVLDDAQEIVYIDACCHYAPAGEKIFSEYVADSIVGVLIQTQPGFNK